MEEKLNLINFIKNSQISFVTNIIIQSEKENSNKLPLPSPHAHTTIKQDGHDGPALLRDPGPLYWKIVSKK
jgi:hypothetical protein